MKLFYRALPTVPDWRLFQIYFSFIRAHCQDRLEISRAFDYAIANIGLDMAALPIYQDYVEWAGRQSTDIIPIDKLRKVYKANVVYIEPRGNIGEGSAVCWLLGLGLRRGGGRLDEGVEFVLLIVNGVGTPTETQIVERESGSIEQRPPIAPGRVPRLESAVGARIAFLGDFQRRDRVLKRSKVVIPAQ